MNYAHAAHSPTQEVEQVVDAKPQEPLNNQPRSTQLRGWHHINVRRDKQGASCQVKDLMFQNLASRNDRVLQLC